MLRLIGLMVVLSFVSCNKYEEDFGKEFWYISSASYCRHSKIRDWDCGKSCSITPKPQDVVVFLNKTGNDAGFGAYHPERKTIMLVFRGTVPWLIKNWIQDINFIKHGYPLCDNDCKVHRGFHNAYLEIHEQVMTHLNFLRLKYPEATITITGHSLGGAMAHHCLGYLQTQGIQVSHFITYGSPRVGDKAYVDWIKQIFPSDKHRVVHSHDPVPHLPLHAWGFKHANTEVYYPKKDKYVICDDEVEEDKQCSFGNLISLNVLHHIFYYDLDQLIQVPLCQ